MTREGKREIMERIDALMQLRTANGQISLDRFKELAQVALILAALVPVTEKEN